MDVMTILINETTRVLSPSPRHLGNQGAQRSSLRAMVMIIDQLTFFTVNLKNLLRLVQQMNSSLFMNIIQ